MQILSEESWAKFIPGAVRLGERGVKCLSGHWTFHHVTVYSSNFMKRPIAHWTLIRPTPSLIGWNMFDYVVDGKMMWQVKCLQMWCQVLTQLQVSQNKHTSSSNEIKNQFVSMHRNHILPKSIVKPLSKSIYVAQKFQPSSSLTLISFEPFVHFNNVGPKNVKFQPSSSPVAFNEVGDLQVHVYLARLLALVLPALIMMAYLGNSFLKNWKFLIQDVIFIYFFKIDRC